jgi:uncharacterized lipoprotein YmbA
LVYHQLHPLAEANVTVPSVPPVEVLPVRLPGLLRRSQLVLAGPTVADAHRWANGLEADVQRVLVGNLANLLGSAAVVAYPDGEGLQGVYRVRLEVDQWEDESTSSVAMQATWMLQKAGKAEPLCLRKSHLQEPLKDASPTALVAAWDHLLLALSKEMAIEISAQKASIRPD